MPELPEVEIVRQSLNKKIKQKKVKKVIIRNRNLRLKIPLKFNTYFLNKRIIKVGRYSKYLIIYLPKDYYCLIHLGMSGTIHIVNNKSVNKYTNTKIKLVKNLHTLTNKKIIVRTREKNRGNSLEKSYSKEIISEDIIILNQKGDFIKGLENFSLHIADNTSTTILDSLWKNFPTLILITDDYFKISSNALQTFSGLNKVGVFHRDIESILEQMKVIKADINKWWTNEILQMEVKLFLESHAKSLNDPKNWLKSFCKI